MKDGYLPIDQAVKLDRAGIERQTNIRYEMFKACIGWLYQSIISDEIVTLNQAWRMAVLSVAEDNQ